MKARDLSERDKERKLDKVESVCRIGKRNYPKGAHTVMDPCEKFLKNLPQPRIM